MLLHPKDLMVFLIELTGFCRRNRTDDFSGFNVFILLCGGFFLCPHFGIKTPDEVESGHAASAPERLIQKLLFQLQLHRFSLRLFTGLLIQGFISLSQPNLQY